MVQTGIVKRFAPEIHIKIFIVCKIIKNYLSVFVLIYLFWFNAVVNSVLRNIKSNVSRETLLYLMEANKNETYISH